jgi:hypothetical protein
MAAPPTVLLVTTQTWLQVTRMAARFLSRGSNVAVICPAESPLAFMPEVTRQFRFRVSSPLGSLRHAIHACGAEYVVPTDDFSVALLHELAGDPRFVPLLERSLGPATSYPVLRSRFQLLSLAHRLGIRVPRTQLVRELQDLDGWVATEDNPFLLKKDGTWGGQGVRVARSAEQAESALQLLSQTEGFRMRAGTWLRDGNGAAFARLRCLRSPELTAQSFIEGIPANSMYACHQGKILGEVQARVAASRGKTGPSIVIQLMQDARMHQAGVKLVEALQISGFFGLDFMLDSTTGEPFLIECNPRATQLGHLAVAGQTDLASMLWAHWAKEPLPRPEDPGLGNSIWIYPDGKRLTEQTASFPICRPDAPPQEMEKLENRVRRQAPPRVRFRRSVRKTFSKIKGTLQWDERPQPFYYPQLLPSDGEPDHAAAAPVSLSSRITIAS